ncbi:hypothetical protein [Streptomyces canus]|uniref:hypothetical protein n=1 Tax=Streptomyces canus TaxID=58343 RepID=UPI00382BEEA2
MTAPRSSLPGQDHPLFQGVFSDWQAKAGVMSALPDAPVVTDDSGTRRPVWHRLRPRPGRGRAWWGGRATARPAVR